jgi:hypothetical protein
VSLFKSAVSHLMEMKSGVDVFHFIGTESVLLFMDDLVRYWAICCANLDFPAEFKC